MVSLAIVAGLMGSRGCYCPLLAVDFVVTGSAIENTAVDIQKGQLADRDGQRHKFAFDKPERFVEATRPN